MNPCQNPSGLFGRLVLRLMNATHAKVTDWGLSHVTIAQADTVLDVGCGGGRTIQKLSELASSGKVYGIDHSPLAVTTATKLNRNTAQAGRVKIFEGSVSDLPFPDNTFNVVTAIETHFWWPDLPRGVREVLRVLVPGGRLALIAEVYKGSDSKTSQLTEKHSARTGLKMLSINEHRELLEGAGFKDISIATDSAKGWICCAAVKP